MQLFYVQNVTSLSTKVNNEHRLTLKRVDLCKTTMAIIKDETRVTVKVNWGHATDIFNTYITTPTNNINKMLQQQGRHTQSVLHPNTRCDQSDRKPTAKRHFTDALIQSRLAMPLCIIEEDNMPT